MNWLKQAPDKPLFPDVLWSRPENKRHAGKLLIIGGHQQSFSAVSEAYSAALKAGAGSVKVILPDKLEKTLRRVFPEAEFAASTPIGSFSRQALGGLLDLADWSDAVLLAGDFGKNSETAILLEGFIDKYIGLLTLTGDSLDYGLKLIGRPNTLAVGQIAQIQKLAQPQATIRQTDDLVQTLNKLSIFTSDIKTNIITAQAKQVIVTVNGRVSTTLVNDEVGPEQAAYATVWWLQQPEKPFEALSTSIVDLNNQAL
jgi:hypothetical protein